MTATRTATRPSPRHAAPRHAAPVTPTLRVVGPRELSPRARRRRARVLAFAGSIVACAVLFGLVAFHVVLTQGQLQLDELRARAAEAQQRYDRYRLEVAELESPERIVSVAQERLGMVPPPEITYLSPTGVKAGVTPAAPRDEERKPATSWPTVKAHLSGRP